ncbi:homing endonuclease [Salmonella phage falkor]|uniref:Homing endonuclease n=1 Tax=Salmonella phage falkor TaxID=2713298 RepID=A0A6G8RKB4_9CAUD|nr:homing endonuclease [Salmonella phage falkor]
MLTQERLKEVLTYDPATGIFINLQSRGNKKAGSIAGTKDKDGYVVIRIDKLPYRAHRLAFLYMEGYMPVEVDHDNRIREDNRWDNLLDASRQENMRNRSSWSKSGYSGISWNKVKQQWQVRVQDNKGNQISGGYFNYKELELAVQKTNELRAHLHGTRGVQEIFKGYKVSGIEELNSEKE